MPYTIEYRETIIIVKYILYLINFIKHFVIVQNVHSLVNKTLHTRNFMLKL